ncbi:Methionine_aminopeptidase [Hexamita inflata]
MVSPEAIHVQPNDVRGTEKTKLLFETLKTNFHTLAWNPRWLPSFGFDQFKLQLDSLVQNGYVNDYPKLVEKKGCYVSQFEHTFMISDWGKEVFTRGEDY